MSVSVAGRGALVKDGEQEMGQRQPQRAAQEGPVSFGLCSPGQGPWPSPTWLCESNGLSLGLLICKLGTSPYLAALSEGSGAGEGEEVSRLQGRSCWQTREGSRWPVPEM